MKREKGWLIKQIRLAKEDRKKWPNWMKKAARWEGTDIIKLKGYKK